MDLAVSSFELEDGRHFSGIIRDLTDIKKTEEALSKSKAQLYQAQKMEAIGKLTGGMAHDFNNLLGVIVGNLDLVLERLKDHKDVQQLTQAALDAALRGADLTGRLLAYARQQPLQSQRIDINASVEEITKLLSRVLGEDIKIKLDLTADAWPVVTDPSQFEAALTNLATNARDAMPRGGQLIITTRNDRLDADYTMHHTEIIPGDYAVIEVSDSGEGMPPEVIARIFEPFYTTKERGKGTGLGLSMVFGFMKQTGGHINVYSEVGKGTTFRLYLPRAEINLPLKPRAEADSAPATGGTETILVVEDNEDVRRVVTRQMNELGYQVQQAEDAAVAMTILEGNAKIDLLFTDIVMPGKMNGMDLARHAAERWPRIKIILTSGFPENKLNGHGDSTANMRLLSKPYRKADLARVLREVLRSD